MLWKPIVKLMDRVEVVRMGERTEPLPVLLNQYGPINSSKNEPVELGNFPQNFASEETDWALGGQSYSNLDGNEYSGDFDLPWLAWDAFIQDIDLADL